MKIQSSFILLKTSSQKQMSQSHRLQCKQELYLIPFLSFRLQLKQFSP